MPKTETNPLITEQLDKVTLQYALIRDEFKPTTLSGDSVWSITLVNSNGAFSTEYRQGAAYRLARDVSKASGSPIGKEKDYQPQPYRNGRDNWLERKRAEQSRPKPPQLVDVLYCLASDAQAVCFGQSFDDFCGEFGYDTDSRTAEKAYNACRDAWSGLIRLGFNIDELAEAFRDY